MRHWDCIVWAGHFSTNRHFHEHMQQKGGVANDQVQVQEEGEGEGGEEQAEGEVAVVVVVVVVEVQLGTNAHV